MGTVSKQRKSQLSAVEEGKIYPLFEALAVVKKTAVAKFDESIDVAVNLGIDAKKQCAAR